MPRQNRRERLANEIAELRAIAFPTPERDDPLAVSHLEVEHTGVVRARVLLDCATAREQL